MSSAEADASLTVALPVWRGADIAWLAMEGLCNQDKANGFAWELLVCEEAQPQQLTRAFFDGYRDRLAEKGCVAVHYFSPDAWIPLPMKWRMMGQAMAPTSRAFLLQAADCYSFKERLNASWRSIAVDGNDWYDVSHGYFYSCLSGKLLLFYQSNADFTQLNMAMAAKHARTIPAASLRNCIDNFLLRQAVVATPTGQFKHYIDQNTYAGVDTNGYNSISVKRELYFSRSPARPFSATDKQLEDIGLPEYIVERIRTSSELLG